MTKQAKLRVEARDTYGKGAARRLRRDGKIPGNLYGHGMEPVAIEADQRALEQLIGSISVDNTLIDLQLGGGRPKSVLIREIQRHPVRSDILHIDFFAIQAGEKVRVDVPIRLEGIPLGVRNAGGILQQTRYELEVECLPRDIPEFFELDVSALEIGDSLHIGDLETGDVTVLEDAEFTVCSVLAPKVVLAEEEEAAEEVPEEVEPEVITARGEEKAEEEDSGE